MSGLSTTGVLAFLLLLQAKHWVFDGPLQTRWMVTDKGRYGRPAGIIHAGLHGAGSALCLLVMAAPGFAVLALALADAVVHYHVDFAKQHIVKRRHWSSDDNIFWWAFTFDQMLHQVTYIAMAAALVSWPA